MLGFLGRGSAIFSEYLNTSAYYIYNNNMILFDCGETVFSQLQKKNLLQKEMEMNVFITHLHADHVGSLPTLISYCYLVLNKKVTVVYPEERIVELIRFMGVGTEFYNYCPSWEEAGKEAGISAKAMHSSHTGDMGSYSYLVSAYGSRFFYSGDSNSIPKSIIHQLENGEIDMIYQDTCKADKPNNTHISLDKLKGLIPGHLRNKVYCMHLDCDFVNEIRESGFNVVSIR